MEVNEMLNKIAKVKTINMSDMYADEKVNEMLQAGWKIIDKYKDVDEAFPYQYYSRSYFILGHEDSQAKIPKDKIDDAINRRKEENT